MSNYLDEVIAEVDFLKPKLEEILGHSAGNIPIKTYDDLRVAIENEINEQISDYRRTSKRIRAWLLEKRKKSIVKSKTKSITKAGVQIASPEFAEYKGILYVNEGNPIGEESRLRLILAHEIGHFYLRNVNPRFKDDGFAHAIENIFFSEGFSEYLALEVLPLICEDGSLRLQVQQKKEQLGEQANKCRTFTSYRHNIAIAPYSIGYEFFKAVLPSYDKDALHQLLANPPKSLDEVYQPAQYLERIRKV